MHVFIFFRKILLNTLIINMVVGCIFLSMQSSVCAEESLEINLEENYSYTNENASDLTEDLENANKEVKDSYNANENSSDSVQDLNTTLIVGECRNPNKKCLNKQIVDDSFSKSTSTIYVDASVGYAALSVPDPNPMAEPLIAILSTVTNTTVNHGGVGYRLYGGFLADVSERVSVGVESGFVYYPSTQALIKIGGASLDFKSLNSTFSTDIFSTGVVPSFIAAMHQRGFGTDFLFNLTIYCIPNLYVSFKPGIQFGYQSNKLLWEIGSNKITDIIGSKNKYSKTALLPEVIVACGWDFFVNSFQINLEFNYQHVFGRDTAIITDLISSRDMVALSFGFSY